VEVLESHRLRVGAAVPDMKAARAAAEAGIDGLAFYRGIPGSIGGALRMNAGTTTCWTLDWVRRVEAVLPGESTPRWIERAAGRGKGEAMRRVAAMYAEGRGTPTNPIEAYFWALLAERNLAALDRERAATQRDELGARISPESRAEVEARAALWRPAQPPDNL
jgi:TPR repeat protein